MSKTEPRSAPNIGFDVEISSGGRAYGEAASAVSPDARTISPTRTAAKEASRRRRTAVLSLVVVGLTAIALWAWLSNPNTNVPPDAVARVNGEYIYEKDVDREINLTKASLYLSKNSRDNLPSRASVLEDLISRRMQVEDARKAGVTVSVAELDNAMKAIMDRTGVTQDKLATALGNYNLKLQDMRDITSDVALINKYIGDYVAKGATSDLDVQTKKNDWLTTLSQTSKIYRLKAPGVGAAPRVGLEAPDFTLSDLNGKQVKLSALRGKPVMINFWATWCPPCRAEIPTLVQAYADAQKGTADAPYRILGVATQSDQPTIQAFVKELGVNFPVLPDVDNRITSDLYHVIPIPTSFFIDKDGIIRFVQVGPVDGPMMDKWLK